MDETDERRISSLTFFEKFILPPIWLGFALFWTVEVAFISGIQRKGPNPLIGCLGLAGFGFGLFYFVRYHFPLKLVWMSERGLRVSNFREEVAIPFDAIEAVVQRADKNLPYVVVTTSADTPFGRRFTFIPRTAKLRGWPFSRGEDEVVVELRHRVAAARKAKAPKLPAGFGQRNGRSPMTDAELDGPF